MRHYYHLISSEIVLIFFWADAFIDFDFIYFFWCPPLSCVKLCMCDNKYEILFTQLLYWHKLLLHGLVNKHFQISCRHCVNRISDLLSYISLCIRRSPDLRVFLCVCFLGLCFCFVLFERYRSVRAIAEFTIDCRPATQMSSRNPACRPTTLSLWYRIQMLAHITCHRL